MVANLHFQLSWYNQIVCVNSQLIIISVWCLMNGTMQGWIVRHLVYICSKSVKQSAYVYQRTKWMNMVACPRGNQPVHNNRWNNTYGWLFKQTSDKCEVAVRHQLIISMNEFMNGWTVGYSNDIYGQCAQCASPMTFWTQNTISRMNCVAICSIRAFFRCLHSNTRTPEACITYCTISQAFFIWISSISTEMVCW